MLAATIETLFTGWELVGLSSALLVAFFQERPSPSRNGLWIWTIYRFSDAASLLAAVAMHHLRGEGNFDKLLGAGSWPDETSLVAVHGSRGRETGGASHRLVASGAIPTSGPRSHRVRQLMPRQLIGGPMPST